MTTTTNFAPLLERFFTQRLMQQRQASPHTLSSYRDTFRQFLMFAQQRLHQPPSRLNVEQIDAPLIVAFLDDLETPARRQRAQPQLTAHGHPFLFSLRRLRAANPFRPDPARARHPQQALYPHLGQLSQPPGSRCVARRPGSSHLVWAARLRVHADRGADRVAFVRDDRTQTRGSGS